jgi:hypothetical protein
MRPGAAAVKDRAQCEAEHGQGGARRLGATGKYSVGSGMPETQDACKPSSSGLKSALPAEKL